MKRQMKNTLLLLAALFLVTIGVSYIPKEKPTSDTISEFEKGVIVGQGSVMIFSAENNGFRTLDHRRLKEIEDSLRQVKGW